MCGTWSPITVGSTSRSSRAARTGYRDIARDAVRLVILGTEVDVASLADVIRSKEAAGREKDRLALPVLRRILAETDG